MHHLLNASNGIYCKGKMPQYLPFQKHTDDIHGHFFEVASINTIKIHG